VDKRRSVVGHTCAGSVTTTSATASGITSEEVRCPENGLRMDECGLVPGWSGAVVAHPIWLVI
jgi:hypothetical protein